MFKNHFIDLNDLVKKLRMLVFGREAFCKDQQLVALRPITLSVKTKKYVRK